MTSIPEPRAVGHGALPELEPAGDGNGQQRDHLWALWPLMVFNWAHCGCVILFPLVVMGAGLAYAGVLFFGAGTLAVLASIGAFLHGLGGHPLVALALLVLGAYGAGALAKRCGQPRVVGEIVIGIVAGPSLLGWIAPAGSAAQAPEAVRTFLFGLGKLGLTLYLLIAGLQVNLGLLRGKGRSASVISAGALAVPLALGVLLGLRIYPDFAPSGVGALQFSGFIGTVMAVSALPVLVRILSERGLLTTALGAMAVACATVDDLVAWLLVGLVLAGLGAGPAQSPLLGLMGLAVLTALLVAAWPLWRIAGRRWSDGRDPAGTGVLPLLLVWTFLVAGLGDSFGLHGGVGAFYAGVLLPLSESLRRELVRWLEPLVLTVLVPTFFVYAGSQTQLQAVDRPELWLLLGGLLAIAVLGKGGGAFLLGRLTGLGWREAAGLAALLNARGVMGLIVLTAGLESGVLPASLFTLLVLTVLATNVVVNPALALFRPSADMVRQ